MVGLTSLFFSEFAMKGDKMEECGRCHKKIGTHRWGRWWLCDECHEIYLKERQSNNKDPTINIPPPEESYHPFSSGWYRQGTGEIYLVKSPYAVEKTISHEVIHHVLNILISPQTSYDYDNVDDHIDDYHTLS